MSSNKDVMISVRGLGKAYSIARSAKDRATTLGETVMKRLRHPLQREERDTFWALNDVSFDVKRGDVVGIIGRNGAGKSTLFKVLSRITEPTTGQIDLYGRVGSLLEVGTGFSGELTGRENIYLNGTILGMRRSEIAKRFDQIVDFSGVEKFLDTPVKRYSSGMYVRLAFAVAAHLDPEILIVDEVLAVGDAEFQEKCLGRLRQVAAGGRTVLFVSHNLSSVANLCSRALVLSNGSPIYYGDASAGLSVYQKFSRSEVTTNVVADKLAADLRDGSGEYRFIRLIATKSTYSCDEMKIFEFVIEQCSSATNTGPFVVLEVRDEWDQVVARCDSRLLSNRLNRSMLYKGRVELRSPWLKPGHYTVTSQIDSGTGFIDLFPRACCFEVSIEMPYAATHEDAIRSCPVLSDFAIVIE